jgi:hypothetical protein
MGRTGGVRSGGKSSLWRAKMSSNIEKELTLKIRRGNDGFVYARCQGVELGRMHENALATEGVFDAWKKCLLSVLDAFIVECDMKCDGWEERKPIDPERN